jgi:hypothetical protein
MEKEAFYSTLSFTALSLEESGGKHSAFGNKESRTNE